MRLLIELPLTIAFFTLAVKYGWPYTIVFVLGYILAFNFKLPFLSRRIRVGPRFLTVFLTAGLSMRKLISVILSREEVQKVISRNVRLKPLDLGFRQDLALWKRWRGYLARCEEVGLRDSCTAGCRAMALAHYQRNPFLS